MKSRLRAAAARLRSMGASEFRSNLLKLAGGTGLAHALTLLAIPVLTRLYSPAEFGVLSVFTSLMLLAMTFSAGRYQVALPLAEDDDTAINLLALAISILTVVSATLLIALLLFGEAIVEALSIEALGRWVWLVPLSLFGAGLFDVFSYWAIRTKAFARVATSRIFQSAGQAGAQIGAGLAKAGVLGLVGGHVVGQLLGAAAFCVRTLAQERAKWPLVSLRRMVEVGKAFKRYPLIYGPSTLINVANLQLVPFVFTTLYGPGPTGFFALAVRVVFLPTSLIGNAVAQVFFNRASVLYQTDRQALRPFVVSVTSKLAVVTTASAAVLLAGGPFLFRIAFGSEWEEAGRYARILAIPQMLQFVYSPISQLFNIFEKQSAHLLWSSALVAASLGSLFGGSLLGSEYASLLLFAISNSAMYGAALLLFRSWLKQVDSGADAAVPPS